MVLPAIAIQQELGTGPGTITGTKFNDRDGDGQRDAGEEGLEGWGVYADLNRDGDRDVDDPFDVTDESGNYSLTVNAGTYLIREELQEGWRQTSPVPRLFATGSNGQLVIQIDPLTGQATVVGTSGAESTYAAAFTPDGTLWTITNAFTGGASQLARIDPYTGVATPVGADVDSPNLATGQLTVQLTNNAQSTDRLRIRNTGTGSGEIGVNGNNVTYEGVVIGTFTGGSGTTALVITLNANSSGESVEALLRAIEFTSTSFTPSTVTRTVRATLTDGDGGTSNLVSKSINIA